MIPISPWPHPLWLSSRYWMPPYAVLAARSTRWCVTWADRMMWAMAAQGPQLPVVTVDVESQRSPLTHPMPTAAFSAPRGWSAVMPFETYARIFGHWVGSWVRPYAAQVSWRRRWYYRRWGNIGTPMHVRAARGPQLEVRRARITNEPMLIDMWNVCQCEACRHVRRTMPVLP